MFSKQRLTTQISLQDPGVQLRSNLIATALYGSPHLVKILTVQRTIVRIFLAFSRQVINTNNLLDQRKKLKGTLECRYQGWGKDPQSSYTNKEPSVFKEWDGLATASDWSFPHLPPLGSCAADSCLEMCPQKTARPSPLSGEPDFVFLGACFTTMLLNQSRDTSSSPSI